MRERYSEQKNTWNTRSTICARDDTCHPQVKPTLPCFPHFLDSSLLSLAVTLPCQQHHYLLRQIFFLLKNFKIYYFPLIKISTLIHIFFIFISFHISLFKKQALFHWNWSFSFNGSVTVSSVHWSSQNPKPITEFVFQKLMADAANHSKTLDLCNTQRQEKRIWQCKSCCWGFIFSDWDCCRWLLCSSGSGNSSNSDFVSVYFLLKSEKKKSFYVGSFLFE